MGALTAYDREMLADSFSNLVTGLGSDKDKAAAGRFNQRPQLHRGTTDALYRFNWLGGKIIDIPADDCTREWRSWQGTKRVVEALEAEEERWKLRNLVNQAMKMAAKDGGAAILVGAGDGDPAEPLDPRLLPRGGIRFLHVVSRWDLSHTEIVRDPMDERFGGPAEWRVFDLMGRSVGIHPSRVIPFIPVPRIDGGAAYDPWGDSVYERLHDAIRDAVGSVSGTASMFQEAKVDVIKIPNLSAQVGNDTYRQAVLKRFALANLLKSISNTLLMDANENWEQKTLSFAGHQDVLMLLLQVVAGAADMPVTRLLGRSPAGLNATGQADLESYYTMVGARQETYLRPALERLDEMLVRNALGRNPRRWEYEWRPLWSMAETDKSDVENKRALAIKALADAKVFDPRALSQAAVNQLEEDGFLPGIAEAATAFPTPEPPPPPDPNAPRGAVGSAAQNRQPSAPASAPRASRTPAAGADE